MSRQRGLDGKWPLTPNLEDAQRRLIVLTGTRISQAEVQRLQWRLDAGDWPNEAAAWVHGFFKMHEDAMAYCQGFESGKASQDAYESFCSRPEHATFA